ncbi:FAD-dependent pyridine nucleotide-disulfide oxidoreductase [Macrophomina phaseolina]|uniref:FAD-dependent pyridine nucleotide-disulfide oxidoreductase n=1 Tax=Macrophomina phaseolina TaxID=35725 RepID=A0ABQ8FV12_9PEZI|nr:FAD-dependent pyridine nucleotide-disulfide oxidoreductase [Macrophomina phaseolina]
MNIVIVGGVAGGMSAATRARRLDETARITVFEKGPYVSYANCGIPYALGKVIEDDGSLILQTPKSFADRFNIDVRLNTEAISIDREKRLVHIRTTDTEEQHQAPYDKLILSQGAEPFRPPIEGVGLPNVFTLQTIMDLQNIRYFISEHRVKRTTIIGGGFIGLEAAENLRKLGLEVTLLEYTSHVFPPVDGDMAEPVHAELRRNCVRLVLNARVQRIQPGCIVQASGEEIPTDLVLLAVGIRARTTLARQAGLKVGKAGVSVNEFMQTSDPDIYAVGDMAETEHRIASRPLPLALAGPANRQGRLAADHIFGKAIRYRGNVGTAACKVFDLTVAATGLSVSSLRQIGHDPLWVTVHPPDHAGYYPGANPIMLKVAFERDTGHLLGTQAVGRNNVDKRIDVFSTALQAGMTILDLEHLELAYAPPFGSAKDPVNMAGFVGSNVLRGDTEIIHAEDLANAKDIDQMQLVDVRSQKEFARGHIRFAKILPLDSLRYSHSGLDKSRRVVVYCQVGYRGYLAYRILKQKGFDVLNLDGGFRAVVESGFATLHTSLQV